MSEAFLKVVRAHRRNEVIEPGPGGFQGELEEWWPARTRVKCDSPTCTFYAVERTWFKACEAHEAHLAETLAAVTAPAGSEDAGLVLSAEERRMLLSWVPLAQGRDDDNIVAAAEHIVAVRVEAARAEERERIAAAIEVEKKNPGVSRTDYGQGYAEGTKDALDAAARIARTPPPAGDARGSQEARNGPVRDGDAGDGRGHGRDDESGRGAGL